MIVQNVNTDAKVDDVSTAIVSNINQHCQLCGLSRENITSGVFRCFSASPQAVTFRAFLHGGAKASSSELASYIEQWIRNDITIPIQSILINVDSSCMVAISSFDDRECQIDPKQPTNNSSSVAIGGTVGSLLIILILGSAVIIAMLIMVWLRKKHQKSSRYRSGLIGGTVGSLLVILILGSAVIIAMLIMVWLRKKHQKSSRYKYME